MTLRLTTGIAAAGCILMASCYPYVEKPPKKPGQRQAEQSVTSAEQQKLKAQREKLKAEEAAKKQEALKPAASKPQDPSAAAIETTTTTPPIEPPKPPVEQPRSDYPFANKVPSKEGFVFSPYNNKVVDVRDIPSGTLVQDPTYPASEKKYFRVP